MNESHFELPPDFIQTVVGLNGDEGRAWLESIPDLLQEVAQRWSLTLLPAFPLSYHYVTPALRSDGQPVVLKLGRPDNEFPRELATLRRFDGNGMVRVLDALPERNIMLLERILPGTPLADRFTADQDEAATAIIADTMMRIQRPAPEGEDATLFATATEWGQGMIRLRDRFEGGTDPLPVVLVEQAESLWHDLLASSASLCLIHGDLHHGNILACGKDDYVAIDPKGLIADPCYEVGPLFYNPSYIHVHPDVRNLMQRRIAILSERTGFSRERIRAWGIAQAVLSAWWSIEDSADGSYDDSWQGAIRCAEHLASLSI